MMSAESPELRELYGGAITTRVPSNFFDSSEIRQVPDNQEVFLDRQSDDSIVFDILERVEGGAISTDVDALKYHAEDIIEAENPTTSSFSTIKLPHLSDTTPSLTCFVSAPPTNTGKYTGILMLLVRLAAQTTDIVVTFNLPGLSVHEDVVVSDQDSLSTRLQTARAAIAGIVDSFDIKDWTLFG